MQRLWKEKKQTLISLEDAQNWIIAMGYTFKVTSNGDRQIQTIDGQNIGPRMSPTALKDVVMVLEDINRLAIEAVNK